VKDGDASSEQHNLSAEACDLGWQESLALLKLLVEAQIPDQM